MDDLLNILFYREVFMFLTFESSVSNIGCKVDMEFTGLNIPVIPTVN